MFFSFLPNFHKENCAKTSMKIKRTKKSSKFVKWITVVYSTS